MISYDKLKEALDIMELPVLISLKDLKKKYKKLAKKYHPDISKDEKLMSKINEAYKILEEYMTNYKFSFSKEEFEKQNPKAYYESRFKF